MSAPHLNLAGAGAAAPEADALTLSGARWMGDRRPVFKPAGWIWGTSAARFGTPSKMLERARAEALGTTTAGPCLLQATRATQRVGSAAKDAIFASFYDPDMRTDAPNTIFFVRLSGCARS